MLSPCDPGFSSSSANRSPCRLAVPEKIFALFACLIFSTAADAPPRCIRHRRRSAPHPHPPRPLLYRISSHLSAHPKAPLCKGSWHGVAVTEWLPAKGNNFISPVGVAESPQGDRLHACPAWGYFSVKKSNQKSLGEDPETPTRRYTPYNRGPRKVARPCGERRMHRSGEGCPEQSAGSARLKRRLRPTRRRL